LSYPAIATRREGEAVAAAAANIWMGERTVGLLLLDDEDWNERNPVLAIRSRNEVADGSGDGSKRIIFGIVD
jgi:hypothetical protein